MRTSFYFLGWLTGLLPPHTSTTEAERSCLADHARGQRRIVEIGVWHGATTRRLRESMASDGILFAVDPYPVGRIGISFPQVIARSTVKASSNGEVRWIRMTGVDSAAEFRRQGELPVDLIFIDGDHSYEGLRGDWLAWRDLVRPGGVIGLHDSRSTDLRRIDDAGSVRYTREVIAGDPQFRIETEIDSLTVLRRVNPTSSQPGGA